MSNQIIQQPYVDLSGILQVQKDILSEANAGYGNTGSGDLPNPLANLSSGLNNLYKSFHQAGISVDDTIQRQNDVINVIDFEKSRLEQKQQNIDVAYIGKQRANDLNENYRLRYKQYIKMSLVIITTLVLFILVSFMSSLFPFIPSSVFDLLSVIIICSGLIIFFYLYTDLMNRNNVYYNELNLPPPIVGNTVVNNKDYDNILLDINYYIRNGMRVCIDKDCCAEGTTWDAAKGTCVVSSECPSTNTKTNTTANTKTNTNTTAIPYSTTPNYVSTNISSIPITTAISNATSGAR
jgi:hypothetical protein